MIVSGRDFIAALVTAGICPRRTQRVMITTDVSGREPVQIVSESIGDDGLLHIVIEAGT